MPCARRGDGSVRDGANVRAGVTVVGNPCRRLGTGAGGSGHGLFSNDFVGSMLP